MPQNSPLAECPHNYNKFSRFESGRNRKYLNQKREYTQTNEYGQSKGYKNLNQSKEYASREYLNYHRVPLNQKERGPYYINAMEELGGVEDKLADMEESLRRNELITNKRKKFFQKTFDKLPRNTLDRSASMYQGRFGSGGRVNIDTDRDYLDYSLDRGSSPIIKRIETGKPPNFH